MQTTPLLTNDAFGFGKLIGAFFVAIIVAIGGGFLLWVKKGGDTAGKAALTATNGFGMRLGEIAREHEQDKGIAQELRRVAEKASEDAKRAEGAVEHLRGRMEEEAKDREKSQRDTMTAITTSARAIQDSIHLVDKQVAALRAEAKFAEQICEGFDKLGSKLVDAMRDRERRETDERRTAEQRGRESR